MNYQHKHLSQDGAAPKGKDKTKARVATCCHCHERAQWPYEDVTGQVILPPSLYPKARATAATCPHDLAQAASWRRPCEQSLDEDTQQAEWTVVSSRRFEPVEVPHTVTSTERAMMQRKNLRIKIQTQEPYFNLDFGNEHLLGSDVGGARGGRRD